MSETVYTVEDERGVCCRIEDADRAERLSRAGLEVNAKTIPNREARAYNRLEWAHEAYRGYNHER